jgi:hypothetical protein
MDHLTIEGVADSCTEMSSPFGQGLGCIHLDLVGFVRFVWERLQPEVGFTQNLIFKQLPAGALRDDLSRGEDVIATGHFEDQTDFLFDKKNSNPQAIDLGDFLEDLLTYQWSETRRGFVNAKQLRFGHEGPADGQHLLFSTREGAGDLRGALLENREQFIDLVQCFQAFLGILLQIGPGHQIFQDGHLTKGSSPFGAKNKPSPDDFMGRDLIDALAVEGHRPFQEDIAGSGPAFDLPFPGHQAADSPKGRGFSGPVRSDQADQLAGVDTHVQIVDENGFFITDG